MNFVIETLVAPGLLRSFVLHTCYLEDFFFLNSLASFPEFVIEPFENNTAGLS